MSMSPESGFGSGPFPDPDEFLRQLSATYEYPLSPLFAEEELRCNQLFRNVRADFYELERSYSTRAGNTWQSFHTGPFQGGDLRLWVIGVSEERTLHIVVNREETDALSGYQKLYYSEYAISPDRPAIGVANSVTRGFPDEVWAPENLQESAAVLRFSQGLVLQRGQRNRMIWPGMPQYTAETPEEQYRYFVQIERSLVKMRGYLGLALQGSFYESGMTGQFPDEDSSIW